MKRCKCEHWQTCPTCYPQGFDEHGARKPVEVPPSREELQRQAVALREQVKKLTKERDEYKSGFEAAASKYRNLKLQMQEVINVC